MGSIQKERYERLKALAICTTCGKAPAVIGHTLCEGCRYKYKKYTECQKAYKKEKPKKIIPKYTIEQINAMAMDRGISYGQMVAILEQKGEGDGRKSIP